MTSSSHPTVREDVAFGPMDEVEERVRDALQKVGITGYENREPHHLSGGEKKRVAIAGILAMKPEIMVLDEPTTGLDPETADGIIRILLELSMEGITVIISSHDVEIISQFAERVFVLNNGKLIAEGTPREIFRDAELISRASLGLPRTADLMNRLRMAGFEVDVKLTVEETYMNSCTSSVEMHTTCYSISCVKRNSTDSYISLERRSTTSYSML